MSINTFSNLSRRELISSIRSFHAQYAGSSSPIPFSMYRDDQLASMHSDYEKMLELQEQAKKIKSSYSSDDWVRMVIWPNTQSKAESQSLKLHDDLMAQAHSIYRSTCSRV